MGKNIFHLLQLGRSGAERRFGELINELRFLFTSFPHLGDAFDADGLPLSFIIKRDARDAHVKMARRQRSAQTAVTTGITSHLKNSGTTRRRGD
jgi:hypothetical protein